MISDLKQKLLSKPWGFEIEWHNKNDYLGRVITMYPTTEISEKFHGGSQETFYLMKGAAFLELGEPNTEKYKSYDLRPGSVFYCPPGTTYKITTDKNGAEFISVSSHNFKNIST